MNYYIFPCMTDGYDCDFPIAFEHPATCMSNIPLGSLCSLQYDIDAFSTMRGRSMTLNFYRCTRVDGVISKDRSSATGYSLTVTSKGRYSGMTVEAYPAHFFGYL